MNLIFGYDVKKVCNCIGVCEVKIRKKHLEDTE